MNCDKQYNIDTKITSPDKINLTVLGGDGRALAAAEKLIRRGYKVTLCGFAEADSYPKGALLSSSFERAIPDADVLLLPLPVTRDGKHVFCPLDSSLSIELEDLCPSEAKAPMIKSDALVFGGKIPENFKISLADHSIFCYDYHDSPTLALINAHISAEGALMYAMEATDSSVLGRNIAVIGYGKIARSLCRLCSAFGANVTVFARREEARTEARLGGVNAAPLSSAELSTLTHGYDIIFNTVPARIMMSETATKLPSGTLYIELASSPFGIDAADARRSEAKVIWASAIPGKYAPVTAGEMIADTVRAEIERIASTGGDKS